MLVTSLVVMDEWHAGSAAVLRSLELTQGALSAEGVEARTVLILGTELGSANAELGAWLARQSDRLRICSAGDDLAGALEREIAADASAVVSISDGRHIIDSEFLAAAELLADDADARVLHPEWIAEAGPRPSLWRSHSPGESLSVTRVIAQEVWAPVLMTRRTALKGLTIPRAASGRDLVRSLNAALATQALIHSNVLESVAVRLGAHAHPLGPLSSDVDVRALIALHPPGDTAPPPTGAVRIVRGAVRRARAASRRLPAPIRAAAGAVSHRAGLTRPRRLRPRPSARLAAALDAATALDSSAAAVARRWRGLPERPASGSAFGSLVLDTLEALRAEGCSPEVLVVTTSIGSSRVGAASRQYLRALTADARAEGAVSGLLFPPDDAAYGETPRRTRLVAAHWSWAQLSPARRQRAIEQVVAWSGARIVVGFGGAIDALGRAVASDRRMSALAITTEGETAPRPGVHVVAAEREPLLERCIELVDRDGVVIRVPSIEEPLTSPSRRDYSYAHDDAVFSDANPFRLLWPRTPQASELSFLGALVDAARARGVALVVDVFAEKAPSSAGGYGDSALRHRGERRGALDTLPTIECHALLSAEPDDALQAMLLSLPVISLRPAGDEGLLEDGVTALEVDGLDVEATLAAVERLAADRSLRRRLIVNAYGRAVESWSWERFRRDLAEQIDELMARALSS